MEDLSKYHQPIGKVLPRGVAAEEAERYRLSEEQVAFFQENGYLHGISCAGSMASDVRVSRFAVESGVSGARVAIVERSGALLARPAFLQAGAAWRSGGVAPGLLLLD